MDMENKHTYVSMCRIFATDGRKVFESESHKHKRVLRPPAKKLYWSEVKLTKKKARETFYRIGRHAMQDLSGLGATGATLEQRLGAESVQEKVQADYLRGVMVKDVVYTVPVYETEPPPQGN